jgi:O-antigen/teichoic acid export membrane protein
VRTPSLTVNAVSNYIRFVLAVVCVFFLTPYLVATLGPSTYGLWSLALCVVGYLELLDCGLSTALMKFVAEYRGSGNREARDRLASTLFITYCVVATVAMILVVAVAWAAPHVFPVPAHTAGTAFYVVLIMGGRLALTLPLSLFMSVLFGEQRIWQINVFRSLSIVGYAILAWIVLGAGGGILALAVVNAIMMLLEHIGYFVACKAAMPDLVIRAGLFDIQLLRRVAGFSVFAMIVNAAAIVLLRTDPMIVAAFLPLSAVAIYALALRISEQILLLTKQFINAFSPVVAELHGAGSTQAIRDVFLRCTKFALAPTVAIVVPGTILSSDAIRLWIGDDFLPAAPILSVLLVAVVFRVVQESASNLLAMTGQHRLVASVAVGNSLLNVVLSLILVVPLGMLGIALGTLMSTSVVGAGILSYCACRRHHIRLANYLQHSAGCLVLPAAIQGAAVAVFSKYRTPETLVEVMTVSLLSAGLFAAAFYVWSLTENERRFAKEKLERLWRIIREAAARARGWVADDSTELTNKQKWQGRESVPVIPVPKVTAVGRYRNGYASHE